jgi:hypothetical protein
MVLASGDMPLSIMTVSIMTFSIMTVSIITNKTDVLIVIILGVSYVECHIY